MKILITGASGFIGSAALDFFSQNHNVTGIDIIGNPKKNILPVNNFEETHELISKNKFDFIINCAGSSNILQSFANPKTDFQLNTGLVQNILNSVKETSSSTKFINLSSAAVYGNPKTLPVKESDTLDPLSPYGLNKLLSEQLINGYHKFHRLGGLSIRIFSAYGPGLKRQFFYDLFSKYNANPKQVELIGTGNESRDFIFITDILEAIDLLMHRGEFKGEVYNLASEQESFILPASQLFAEICGFKGEIIFTKKQLDGYPLNWKADISKIKSLGFSPRVKLEEGLKLYYNWVKSKM